MQVSENNVSESLSRQHPGITPDISIELVQSLDYIQEYIGVIALKDTVRLSYDIGRFTVMNIRPWDMDARMAEYDKRKQALGYELGRELKPPAPPTQCKNNDQIVTAAQAEVHRRLQAKDNAEKYATLSRLDRSKEVTRYIFKKESLYVPRYKHPDILPDVMVFLDLDSQAQRVVVDGGSENVSG